MLQNYFKEKDNEYLLPFILFYCDLLQANSIVLLCAVSLFIITFVYCSFFENNVMAIIGYLFFGIIIVAIAAYLFYVLRTAIIIGAFLLGVYLIFFTDHLMLGCLSLVVWLVTACAAERAAEEKEGKTDATFREEKKRDEGFFSSPKPAARSGKRKAASRSGSNLSYILLWLIPLFWPVLIFQTFFRDKQAGKLNEYDYEQHLKSNGK